MKRLILGMVPLFAILVVVGCSTDPTSDLQNGVDRLVAAPSQLFIELGATKTVDVSAVDEQGNPLQFNYQVTATGAGVTVKRDSTYLPVFVNDTELQVPEVGPTFRFKVLATAYGPTSFTVSAGGKDLVVPVQVVPQNRIAATFSSLTPALGDTVTLTAPPGTTFSQTSEFTFGGDTLQPPLIVERDPGGTFVRFIPPPNKKSPITITEVSSTAAPGVLFGPTTSDVLVTPQVDSVDVTFSQTTPNVGQVVTVTLPALLKFQPTTTLTFPDQLASGAAFTTAADSNSLTFQSPPNATGAGVIDSVVFPGGFAVELPTRPTITAENIGTTVAAVFTPLTPAVNQTVTLTPPAGFSFDPAATITIADAAPFLVSQSSSQIKFIPTPGQTGPATLVGVILNSAPQFSLTLPTADTLVTSTSVPSLGGTGDSASAPLLTLPGPGASNTLFDAGTFPGDFFGQGFAADLIYKLTIPAGGVSLTLNWSNSSDIDIILCDDGCANIVDVAGATSNQPEQSSFAGVPPGTYYLVIDLFAGGPPSWINLTLTRP
jgi:pre-peptidase